ncbi:phage terminase large subunit [Candidatus Pacearchaeota archaeon]|nr:phage terminase large subunit [Candidatus Pacearchaeota archaeon]
MPKIECVNKLGVFLSKKKRVKILVGGRASTKSTFVADVVLSKVNEGQTWCCAREFQNSIDDSVHSMLIDEIGRCEFEGFSPSKTEIVHSLGGKIFYKGLARNITSLKGLNNLKGLWIEEGESLSADTIKVLTASVRLSAAEAKRMRERGELLEVPEIWITMNRGSSKDPIAQKFLKRAEKDLAKCGYYEDDNVMIMQINYTDIPRQWFLDSGLESERADDEKNLTQAEYDHKWHGHYSDTIENAIIKPEWFDACIDAHKKLGFKAEGQEKISFDPADVGSDPEALAYMHGRVVLEAISNDSKAIDDACDWAASFANEVQADVFLWDCDGMGIGLKRQVSDAFKGKKVTFDQFKGSQSPYSPDSIYQPLDNDSRKPKSNKESFLNQRAQCYWALRDSIRKTYKAVKKGQYINPEELISFSSGITHLDVLRSELCSIPRKFGGSGKIQLMSKIEMLKMGITSPNIADCIMMLHKPVDIEENELNMDDIPLGEWA